jgi:predicted phage terminase large subunit-like protein
MPTAAEELLARRHAKERLVEFMKWTTPRWEPGKIHHEICKQLSRIASGEIDRLMLLCPPQHGKSEIVSKRLPAWMLGLDPTLDIISASATGDLAAEFGGAVRDCVKSPEYKKLFDTAMSEATQSKGRWVTEQGGGYYAVGIGGALFGRGAGLAIVDDPFSTWEDAQSPLAQERVWSWYRGTLYNRIRPGGAIIVIQHRTGANDLVAKLLEEEQHGGDKWTIVKLPADLEDPPWPERYDRAALERLKANVSPMMWESLYLQDPVPVGGSFFKAEWVGEYEETPQGLSIYAASDFAVTAGSGDWTEHGVFGLDQNGNIYVLDWWRGQTAPDVWIERMCDLVLHHRPLTWFGEAGVIRRSVEPFLMKRMQERNAYCNVEWLPSIADKPSRARSIQARMSMGKVWLPKHRLWKADLVSQLLRFPSGKHDDAVDVLSLIGRGLDMTVNHAPKSRGNSERYLGAGGWMG